MQIRLGQGTHAFLVRVHVEPREIPGATPRLTIRVRYLRTGRERYVRTLAELGTFIRACIEEAGEDLSEWGPS